MAAQRRASRKRGCRRNRRRNQYGGTDVQGYRFGASVDPTNPSLGNAAQVNRYAACDAAVRPGYMQGAQIQGGLPGFSGGRRQMSIPEPATEAEIAEIATGQMNEPTMSGGRYAFEANPNLGYAERVYNGCGDVAVHNPLNKPFDISSIVSAPAAKPMAGGRRRRNTRRSHRVNQAGGVGGVDSMVYQVPRAGYTHTPSIGSPGGGALADGKTPFLINVPYSSQEVPSSACLKTGGGHKASKKSRKPSRKASRKASHRSRKQRLSRRH